MSRLVIITLLFLVCTGCLVKHPVRALYCESRNADGTCHTWATTVPNRECVPSPAGVYGVCQ